MLRGMDEQLSAARQALDNLTTDEVELSRLQADHQAQIDKLKASGSRDFAALAELEGKRAALTTMLAEQRRAISEARAHLVRLETAQAEAQMLVELRTKCAGLQDRREKVDALLTELGEVLRSHLQQVAQERTAWAAELAEAQAQAVRLRGLRPLREVSRWNQPQDLGDWQATFAEIGEGAEVALTLDPTTRHPSGLLTAYAGVVDASALDAARRPVVGYFDRPVAFVVAAALAAVDRAMPHPLGGGER